MRLTPLVSARVRALSIISVCLVLVTIAAVWGRRQQASAPDKTDITPAGTITVNSTPDTTNATDGLCTLREAINHFPGLRLNLRTVKFAAWSLTGLPLVQPFQSPRRAA